MMMVEVEVEFAIVLEIVKSTDDNVGRRVYETWIGIRNAGAGGEGGGGGRGGAGPVVEAGAALVASVAATFAAARNGARFPSRSR